MDAGCDPGSSFLDETLDPGSEAGRERLALAIANFGLGFFNTDFATGKARCTPNVLPMFGLPPQTELPIDRTLLWGCYHPDDIGWARETFAADFRGERGRDTYCERVRIIRRDDAKLRWIEWSGRMFGPPGARTHIVGMVRDVTEEVEREERLRLLMREVDHRARDTLAVVQSLVRLTSGEDVADYRRRLEARVLSLARTHSLLGAAEGRTTGLAALVESELGAYRDHLDVSLSAPPLGAHAVQPVAMVLHEFATNAAKHGALSTAAGRVALAAQVEDHDVMLAWTETGGPALAAPPTRSGTGRSVVQAQIRRLGGLLTYHWRPAGLCVELQVPLERWIG